MASSSRSRDISQQEWEQYRAEVTSLFQNKSYKEIIDHLDRNFDFRLSPSQFALQVRSRWKLKKNFKRKSQKDIFDTLPVEGEKPEQVLVDNRPISYKRLRKAAIATSTAERKQPDGKTDEGSGKSFSPVVKDQKSTNDKVAVDDCDAHAPFTQFKACMEAICKCLQNLQYVFPDSCDASKLGIELSRVSVQLIASASLLPTLPIGDECSGPPYLIPDVIKRVLARLPYLSTDLTERGALLTIGTQGKRSKFIASMYLLLSKIHDASNNLLDALAMSNMLAWISKEQLLWVVEILVDHQLPTMISFAYLLFRTAVADRDTVTIAALLHRGINPLGGENGSLRSLRVAIENSDATMVRALLEAGARIDSSQKDLVAASKGPKLCPIIIRMLLQHIAIEHQEINPVAVKAVLNKALELNVTEIVEDLLVHPVLVNEHLYNYTATALQIAAKHCDSNTVKLLIDAGSDVNAPIGSKYAAARREATAIGQADYFITSLQHAVKRNDLLMVKILLENGACVDGFDVYSAIPKFYYVTKAGKIISTAECVSPHNCDESDFIQHQNQHHSPLQSAAANKSIPMIQLLFKYNPKINAMGSVGTALQVACMQSDNLQVTVMLVQAGADVNSPAHTWHGSTALQAAILSRNMDAVDYLIGKGANISDRPGITMGLTALQAAVKTQNTRLVAKLMNLGADVNENCSHFRHEMSVNLAARCGNLELFDLLVSNGAYDVGPVMLARYETVLLDAIASGSHAIVERVIATRTKAGLQDAIWNFRDPGFVAAAIKHGRSMFETVQRLLVMGASSNACGDDLKTPLQLAAYHSTLDLVKLLVKKGAKVNLAFNESPPALIEAIRRQDESMVDFLIEAGSRLHSPENDDAQAALIEAASTGNLNIVRMVLDAMKRKCTCTNLPYIGLLALTEAVRCNQPEVVRFLRDANPAVQSVCSQIHLPNTRPLSKAIEGKNYGIINMLLEHDSTYYSRDSLALAHAARIGDIRLMRRLLLLEFDFDDSTDIFSLYNKALRQTASHEHVDVAKALIAAGADINVAWAKSTGPSYFTCMLNESIMSESLEMVKFLLDNGAHVNGPKDLQILRFEAKGPVLTPLQCAVTLGDSTVMQLLLDSGADVHAPASGLENRSTLEIAAENNRLDMTHDSAMGMQNTSTLEIAAENDRIVMVDISVLGLGLENKSTLEIAAENGRLDMVHKLLKLDRQPETLTERIAKAASHAMRNDYPVVSQYLMDWQLFN